MKDASMNNNIETEMDNERNPQSSIIQDYEMLALHAYQQIHRQLHVNPFKDAVIAYRITSTDKAIIYQVSHFTDNWKQKPFWKLDIVLGKINESLAHQLKIESNQRNDTTIKLFEHFNDNNNIENIHRLAGISARQPVDNIDDLIKELFLELTEKFVRNFDY